MLRTRPDKNVETSLHDVATLRAKYPEWDTYTKKQKLFAARRVAPIEQSFEHNTPCEGQYTLISRLMDREDPLTKSDLEWYIAIGDGTDTPLETNTQVNNLIEELPVTDTLNQNGETLFSVFVDSGELNNESPTELAVICVINGTTKLQMNHSLFGEFNKQSNKTATLDAYLNWGASA